MKRILLFTLVLFISSFMFSKPFNTTRKIRGIETEITGAEIVQLFIEHGFYLKCIKADGNVYIIPKTEIIYYEVYDEGFLLHTSNGKIYTYNLNEYEIESNTYYDIIVTRK